MRDADLTLRAPAQRVRRAEPTGCRAASWPRSRADLLDREGALGVVAAGRRRAARLRARATASWASMRPRPRPRAARAGDRRSASGDDVVHAAFGEGVVTGVEPGGVVVVRFAERRLRAQADGRVRADHEALTGSVADREHAQRSSTARRSRRGAGGGGPRTSRRSSPRTGRAPGPGDGARRRGPGQRRSTSAASSKASAEVGIAPLRTTACRPTRRAEQVEARRSTHSTPTDAVSGILCSCRCPTTSTASTLTGLIDPRKDVDGLTPSAPGCSRSARRACGRARRRA